MADKVADQKESTTPEVEKEEKEVEEVTEDTVKVKNGDAAKNGDADDKGEDAEKDEKDGEDATDAKICSIKRKSAGGGGDAPEDTPAEGATPEKKAKLNDADEASSNGEAKVAA